LIRGTISLGAYDKWLDPYLAMSMLMGGMCHPTAVWLPYRRPNDLVQRGKELFDGIEKSCSIASNCPVLSGSRLRRGRSNRPPALTGELSPGFGIDTSRGLDRFYCDL